MSHLEYPKGGASTRGPDEIKKNRRGMLLLDGFFYSTITVGRKVQN